MCIRDRVGNPNATFSTTFAVLFPTPGISTGYWKAKNNETVTTLDSQIRKLTNDDLVITDGDKPIALAGVMGGLETEVTDSTVNLLIESAYFDKVSIMKTSRKLGLISDASIRFERGIDFNIQKYGLEQFLMTLKASQAVSYTHLTLPTNREV